MKLFCLIVLLALVAGFNALPLEEAVTRGRHTDGPVTHEPPHTDEPVTHAPVTHEPSTHAPVTHEPVTHEPITEAPVTHEPVTHEPVTHEPTTSAPVTHDPATHAPTTNSPVTQHPDANDLTVNEGGKIYHVTCKTEGPMSHPGNVHKYLVCEYEADHKHWHVIVMPCAIGTRWHDAIKNCIADN